MSMNSLEKIPAHNKLMAFLQLCVHAGCDVSDGAIIMQLFQEFLIEGYEAKKKQLELNQKLKELDLFESEFKLTQLKEQIEDETRKLEELKSEREKLTMSPKKTRKKKQSKKK